MFSSAQAKTQLQLLYKHFKQQKEQGVEKNFKFKITFSCKQNLQGKKLKCAIDDYHYLTPGTTKRTKSKPAKYHGECISTKLDDRYTCFKLGFQIYKVFGNKEYKGKIIWYDSNNRLYIVEYKDEDTEEFYHNEIHSHRNQTKDTQVKQYVSRSGCRNQTISPQAKSSPPN